MAATGQGPLSGKVAVVTGASRRIGRAVALGLAEAGADVAVHARQSRDEIEGVAAEIHAMGRRSVALLGDITVEAEVVRLFGEIGAALGGVDILVNNAAIRGHRPFLEMTLAEWHERLAVILDGAFLCSREALRSMVTRGGGTIVNIGGATAHTGTTARAHVSTAKAGLVGLTKALAVEFAPQGVNVNCVAPGKIGGPRAASAGESAALGNILVGREGHIEEAAHMILALCMPQAKYMTGQTVHVSGGLYMP